MMSGKDPTIGSMRFLADKRQFAGLLMVNGLCAVLMPLFPITGTIEKDGGTPTSGLAFASFLGALFVLATGIVSVLVGYFETVHDVGHRYATLVGIVLSQLVWLAYLTSMIGVGMAAKTGDAFIPEGYDFNSSDVAFIGAMGILGIAAYGFSLVGAVAFFQFAVYAFQAGRPGDRNSSYFHSRQRFYAFITYLAGASQLALGAYCQARFGSLESGPIVVGFYVVSYPSLTIVAGIAQLVIGSWCFARTFGLFLLPGREYYFSIAVGFGWLVQLFFQVIPQIGAAPGSDLAGVAAFVASFGFGLNLMPAYLDHKARNTPDVISGEYYGFERVSESAPLSDV